MLQVAFCIWHDTPHLHAQQLVDRVLARVGTVAVTLTDVRAAVGLGLVEIGPGENRDEVALSRAIDRQLILSEVARFPPAEPAADAVAQEVAAMKKHAGSGLDALMAANGIDESKLAELARETLRIRAYISQRFGTTAQVTEDEARTYYEAHLDEFTRNGARVSFEEAESLARQRASGERLQNTITRWTADLRMRAEVVIVNDKRE